VSAKDKCPNMWQKAVVCVSLFGKHIYEQAFSLMKLYKTT